METTARFGYPCPECGQGTVQATQIQNYKTKIKGYPFIVDEALVGVCDNCKARHFTPQETRRWEELFYRSLEEQRAFLTPHEITSLRNDLVLSMEDFARLIGCTRQSIYNWEKPNRTSPPSRMADLLMKLVKQSLVSEKVDVITFLLDEAKKWGVTIQVQRNIMSHQNNQSLVLLPKPIAKSTLIKQSEEWALAAATDLDEKVIALETSEGSRVGILKHDFQQAALVLSVTGNLPPWETADFEVETHDGRRFVRKGLSLQERDIVLQRETKIQEEDVSQITLKPHYE